MFNIPGDPLTIQSNTLGVVWGMPITNTMTMAFIQILLFVILIIISSRFSVFKPSKFQMAVEGLLEIIQGLIRQIVGDDKIAARIMPFVVSLTLFILVADIILTFLPFLAGFTYNGVSIFRSYTNDFNTTFALSVVSVIATQIYSIVTVNPINYVFRFVRINEVIKGFSKSLKDGFMSIISAFVGLLDIISEFAKTISLSLRLFGNMYAGELLQGVLITIFAILLPVPMIGLSLLAGVIQAIVFGSLVSSSIAGVLKT